MTQFCKIESDFAETTNLIEDNLYMNKHRAVYSKVNIFLYASEFQDGCHHKANLYCTYISLKPQNYLKGQLFGIFLYKICLFFNLFVN
jgi:hypothetical protein